MDTRDQKKQAQKETEEKYRGFLDKTVTLLQDRDQEEKDKRKNLISSYRQELQKQMQEQKDAEAKRWNEMDPSLRKMNIKGISAYEAAQATTGTQALPGFEVDKTFDKDDFKRKSTAKTINFGKNTASAGGNPISPIKPLSSLDHKSRQSPERMKHYTMGKMAIDRASTRKLETAGMLISQQKMPDYAQRTSRQRSSVNYDDLAGRRSPRLNVNPITGKDEDERSDALGLSRQRKSMAQLPSGGYKQIDTIQKPQPSPWDRDPDELPMQQTVSF